MRAIGVVAWLVFALIPDPSAGQSLEYKHIHGIIPTVFTPYDDQRRIDRVALEAQVNYLIESGVHGLLVMGSIGESPYLSLEDRAVVISATVKAAAGRVPVLAGVTAAGTRVAETQLQQAKNLGASAVIVGLPVYFKLSFSDVRGHFKKLSDLNLLPIFYYNYPSATHLKLTAKQIADIMSLRNVVGIKESTFDMNSIRERMELVSDKQRVFLSGSELNLVQFMEMGGHGAVSVGAMFMPKTTVATYTAMKKGDIAEATKRQNQLFETLPLVKNSAIPVFLARPAFLEALKKGLGVPVGVEPTQARLKAALSKRGIPIEPHVRSPLPAITDRDRQRAAAAMRKIMRIEQ